MRIMNYKKKDWRENYLMYLRDGLIESLVHERTHSYISTYYNLYPLLNFLKALQLTSQRGILGISLESIF